MVLSFPFLFTELPFLSCFFVLGLLPEACIKAVVLSFLLLFVEVAMSKKTYEDVGWVGLASTRELSLLSFPDENLEKPIVEEFDYNQPTKAKRKREKKRTCPTDGGRPRSSSSAVDDDDGGGRSAATGTGEAEELQGPPAPAPDAYWLYDWYGEAAGGGVDHDRECAAVTVGCGRGDGDGAGLDATEGGVVEVGGGDDLLIAGGGGEDAKLGRNGFLWGDAASLVSGKGDNEGVTARLPTCSTGLDESTWALPKGAFST
ncbi:hypothetical protein BDN72DRAFT_928210 [Pluteus cervinus]|uniref:Uncharacterized protein n=1 Tax=Pluteus cervinus TaxID=181527 RepID=A0ACD3ACX1_9AGAR|nr:hypothetical protein BDN72DRAFT_928210 [Pluteus cervinus]